VFPLAFILLLNERGKPVEISANKNQSPGRNTLSELAILRLILQSTKEAACEGQTTIGNGPWAAGKTSALVQFALGLVRFALWRASDFSCLLLVGKDRIRLDCQAQAGTLKPFSANPMN
jgi:hypothetical protein